MTRWALGQVAADPDVRDGLRHARVLEILGPGQRLLPGIEAEPVVTFTAVGELAESITAPGLPAGTRAVLYDPEAWPFTPASEQRDPARAAARAAELAHGNGRQIIVAPALSLVTVMAADSKAPRWRRFLDLGIAAAVAEVADVLELQAQSLERDPDAYASFVTAAADQARAANPRISILAGLSTNPPGDAVSARQLVAAVRATRAVVTGYWLNIPRPGPHCPTCNPPQPGIGVELLLAFL